MPQNADDIIFEEPALHGNEGSDNEDDPFNLKLVVEHLREEMKQWSAMVELAHKRLDKRRLKKRRRSPSSSSS